MTADASGSIDHRELLLQAKQRQKSDLTDSAELSDLIARTAHAIIKINSANNSLDCPPVLDKITTIHDLDREIDRQLHQDIAGNYEKLINAKRKLTSYVKKTQHAMAMNNDNKESFVELLQRKAELVDQDLRILETTLRLVKEHRNVN